MKKNRAMSWEKGLLQRGFYFMNLKSRKIKNVQLAVYYAQWDKGGGQGVRDREEKSKFSDICGRAKKIMAEVLLQKSKRTTR